MLTSHSTKTSDRKITSLVENPSIITSFNADESERIIKKLITVETPTPFPTILVIGPMFAGKSELLVRTITTLKATTLGALCLCLRFDRRKQKQISKLLTLNEDTWNWKLSHRAFTKTIRDKYNPEMSGLYTHSKQFCQALCVDYVDLELIEILTNPKKCFLIKTKEPAETTFIPKIFCLDEIQFATSKRTDGVVYDLVHLLRNIPSLDKDVRFLFTGLNGVFDQTAWPVISEVLPLMSTTHTFFGRCMKCGLNPSVYSMRHESDYYNNIEIEKVKLAPGESAENQDPRVKLGGVKDYYTLCYPCWSKQKKNK